MNRKHDRKLIAGLDIGTSKVVTIIGEILPSNTVKIIGVGSYPSRGLKRGVVVNIDSTVDAIQKSSAEAETMAGCGVYSVFTGIAGSHIKSLNSYGIVAIQDSEVSQADVDRVIDAARAVAIPADQKILHILPQDYVIDNQDGIKEPIGMSGVRLEAKVHMVTGAVSSAQNIVKCVKKCGFNVGDIILEQLASSLSVLSEDEKDLGVCLVDIGGGTSDIAIFINGSIRHTAVIPIAGDQVTNDLAMALRTPARSAEKIKMKYSCALKEMIDDDLVVKVPSVSDRPGVEISHKEITEVVEARYAELFYLIKVELQRSGFYDLIPSGVVLTGGSSKVKGGVYLAEKIFNMPVRLGIPQHVEGLDKVVSNPIYSTSVGLLLYGLQQRRLTSSNDYAQTNGWKDLFLRMKQWFHKGL